MIKGRGWTGEITILAGLIFRHALIDSATASGSLFHLPQNFILTDKVQRRPKYYSPGAYEPNGPPKRRRYLCHIGRPSERQRDTC
jgi:hypothetical protein